MTMSTVSDEASGASKNSFNLRHLRVGPTILHSLHEKENLENVLLGPIFSSTVTVASIVASLPSTLKSLDLDLTRLSGRRSSSCSGGNASSASGEFCWSKEMGILVQGLPASLEHLSLRFPRHNHSNNSNPANQPISNNDDTETDIGVVALAESFIHKKTIACVKTLDLRGNHLGDRGVIALAGAVRHIPYLQNLILSWNDIGSDGFIALAETLHCKKNKLKELDVSFNKHLHFDKTLKAFSRALQTNVHLKNLSISNCTQDLDIAALESLLDCVKQHNFTIEHIHLDRSRRPMRHDPRAASSSTAEAVDSGNAAGDGPATEADNNQSMLRREEGGRKPRKSVDELLRDLEYYLSLNRAGRWLLDNDVDRESQRKCNKKIPVGIWPHILAKKQPRSVSFPSISSAPNAMFYFLRERPDLCGYHRKKCGQADSIYVAPESKCT